MILLGILSPTGLVLLIIVYLLVLISSLFFVFKNENGLIMFIWLIAILFFPLIGGLIYLFKYFITQRKV